VTFFHRLVLVAGLLGMAASPAFADAPAPSPTASAAPQMIPVVGGQMTLHEFATLVSGAVGIAGGNVPGYRVTIQNGTPKDMPAYAPDWNYLGTTTRPDGTKLLTIVVANSLSEKDRVEAELRALLLGLCDAGYGGDNPRALYDKAKAADTALGPNASNPQQNRRALGNDLGGIFDLLLEKQKT
jgi:hypothetical protein